MVGCVTHESICQHEASETTCIGSYICCWCCEKLHLFGPASHYCDYDQFDEDWDSPRKGRPSLPFPFFFLLLDVNPMLWISTQVHLFLLLLLCLFRCTFHATALSCYTHNLSHPRAAAAAAAAATGNISSFLVSSFKIESISDARYRVVIFPFRAQWTAMSRSHSLSVHVQLVVQQVWMSSCVSLFASLTNALSWAKFIHISTVVELQYWHLRLRIAMAPAINWFCVDWRLSTLNIFFRRRSEWSTNSRIV